jgi:hypothetical protein
MQPTGNVFFSSSLILAAYFGACPTNVDPQFEMLWFMSMLGIAVGVIALVPYAFRSLTCNHQNDLCLLVHVIRIIVHVTLLLIFSQNLHFARLSPVYIPMEYGCIIPVIVCMNVVTLNPRNTFWWNVGGALLVLGWLFSNSERTASLSYALANISGRVLTLLLTAIYAIPYIPNSTIISTQQITSKALLYLTCVCLARMRFYSTDVTDNTQQLHDYYSLRIATNVDYLPGSTGISNEGVFWKYVLSTAIRCYLLACICMESTAIRDIVDRYKNRIHVQYMVDLHELMFVLTLYMVCSAALGASRDHDFAHSALYTPSTYHDIHSMGLLWCIGITLCCYLIVQLLINTKI